jgi:hypothetical protein
MPIKPYRGIIKNWKKVYFNKEEHPTLPDNLGYVIQGVPVGHSSFKDWIQTSAIVKEGEGEVETLNSRYDLGGTSRWLTNGLLVVRTGFMETCLSSRTMTAIPSVLSRVLKKCMRL